jgi:NADH-quinone oxidoreductase subunit K
MLTVGINFVFNLTCIVFFIGLIGVVLNRKNILLVIMSIELMLLAVNLNFAAFSIYLDDIVGQIFVLFILAVAAAESAIGLSIITVLYRLKNSTQLHPIKKKINSKL